MTYYLHNNGVIRNDAECPGKGTYCHPKPVVVIDPQVPGSREPIQVWLRTSAENLRSRGFTAHARVLDGLADQIDPRAPKPDEPTDPKVRVTDRRDNIWRLLADGDWVCVDGPDRGEYRSWSALADSPGVRALPVGEFA